MELKRKTTYVLKEMNTVLTVSEMHYYEQFEALFYDDSYNQVKELGRYEIAEEAAKALADHKNEYIKGDELYYVTEYGVEEIEESFDENGVVDDAYTSDGFWHTAEDDTEHNFVQAKDEADKEYDIINYRNTRRW